jgi:hypothetical protein
LNALNAHEVTQAGPQLGAGDVGDTLSSEYAWHAGAYENQGRYLAINRPPSEDQIDVVDDKRLEQLFAGLKFSRVDDQAGSLAGIVREIWQMFLLAMIAAMLIEAVLCLPRKPQVTSSNFAKASPAS